jgi:hypothetical protein
VSLDVYLTGAEDVPALDGVRDRIFIRENGQTKEITREEWNERFPDREPTVLHSDDAILEGSHTAYEANITHNLGKMAREAGLYEPLWRPDEIGIEKAAQLVEPLRTGLTTLLSDREHFEQFNPENGWGDYDVLVQFTAGYLAACESWPEAHVEVSR